MLSVEIERLIHAELRDKAIITLAEEIENLQKEIKSIKEDTLF